jgi:hypothetical protein
VTDPREKIVLLTRLLAWRSSNGYRGDHDFLIDLDFLIDIDSLTDATYM